jgi:hypothetical protein
MGNTAAILLIQLGGEILMDYKTDKIKMFERIS